MKKAPHRDNDSGAFGEQLSFLPEPDFNALLPNPGTLQFALLRRLLKGEQLEQPEWLQLTGSWRLAATVQQLKKMGWGIIALAVTRSGHEKPIARYLVPSLVIKRALRVFGEALK
jgi:hypothetical protein